MPLFSRSSGILLHPTSLPGRYGIGDLGSWAYHFVDYLHAAGQSIWQVLPLGPTGYGDSPYQSLSSFAGNTNLISLDRLVEDGWLAESDLENVPQFPSDRVDFGPVIEYHNQILAAAHANFEADSHSKDVFEAWCEENAFWLDDFALFAALKEANGGQAWVKWPHGEAARSEKAVSAARKTYSQRIAEHRFLQWVFATQWAELKDYANDKGIRIIGDVPIFVAHDSSDVWANRDLFYLDDSGNPTVIAGVPPDYFSPTGQRWGNPLYRWDRMAPDYAWWIQRVESALSRFDIVRIDHFRGFEAYFEIPASESTARKGRWVKGPDRDFFNALSSAIRDSLGKELNEVIIAEDLGVITKEVNELRNAWELPGMIILQFAFVNEERFLPHNHHPNSIVYTGTHDNNTMMGWWLGESSKEQREYMKRYLSKDEITQPNWEMIRLGMQSVAHTFIMPLQDILGTGAETRMNTPSVPSGNWVWRCPPDALQDPWRTILPDLTRLYQRWP
jgi:4-alpha-glucanotransferase